MIVVTGGAGFIGSNIVKGLNKKGFKNIIIVDDLKDGRKFSNLVNLDIIDYFDKDEFLNLILSNKILDIEVIFHQGACSSTTEWDGKFMMENNYSYSKNLLNYCLDYKIPFLYASSAAVYGGRNDNFIESFEFENPLNVYGYSKILFDNYVRKILSAAQSQICGFRYFNVYGPNENHKGNMASVAFHLNNQIINGQNPKLFEGSDNFKRDFIYVEDVVDVNLWFWENKKSGIYNCGTGCADSFQNLADAVLNYHKLDGLEYIPFPQHLKNCYQTFTQANLSKLREVGYTNKFKPISEGILNYMKYLNK